jgi:hypothetical protein
MILVDCRGLAQVHLCGDLALDPVGFALQPVAQCFKFAD